MVGFLREVALVIEFDPEHSTFHLKGNSSSYLLALSPSRDPQLLHWGAALGDGDVVQLARLWRTKAGDPLLEKLRRDYASFGNNDLRSPALHLEHPDGSRISAFTYLEHEITAGKSVPHGLPGTLVEPGDKAATLRLRLVDGLRAQQLDLYYTLYPEMDILVRRAVIKQMKGTGCIQKIMSASVDFPVAARPYWSVSLPGDWARERMVQKAELKQGLVRAEGRRGSQFHDMSPFLAVSQGPPAEDSGPVWSFALVYSGNWLIEAETHPSGRLRINAGINDFDFKWRLDEGESFDAPECVLAFASGGLGAMSRNLHDFVRGRVCRGPWRDRDRPVLLNSWEGLHFGFKHEDIVALAAEGKALGAELLVLDDGWFGKRDDDRTSLGDWVEDVRKLPQGIRGLSRDIHALGLKFGLWFEPESVSPDSELFRKHPGWGLTLAGRPGSTHRTQHVLDMSRAEVRDHLFERLSHTIEDAGLDYIKWDMNRPLWELGSDAWPAGRQSELSHRFILGTYELMGRLRDRYPEVLVEGCAGGGGRFDLGMLCYQPQFWASDNTDALDRVLIQWGGSLFLPAVSVGAHISGIPNQLTGRSTPMRLRALVAMSANLGIELDPSTLSRQDKNELATALARYKEIRRLVRLGDLYRLEDPFAGPRSAWSIVAKDKSEAVVFVVQPLASLPGLDPRPLRLAGLDPAADYRISDLDQTWSGAALMAGCLLPDLGKGDYAGAMVRLIRR